MKSDRHIFDVVHTLVKSELKVEASSSLCGWIWWILDPALSLLIYYIAFGVILNRNTEGFLPFLCVGVIFWRWFQGSVMKGAGSILQAAPLFSKVPIHKMIFPVVSVLADGFRFLASLLLLFIFLKVFQVDFGFSLIYLPLLLITQFLLILFIATSFATVVPFLPDLKNMIGHGMHLLFFLSGIFFDPGKLEGWPRTLVFLNPISGLLASARGVLLRNEPADLSYILTVLAISITGLGLNRFTLGILDRSFLKVV